MHTEPGAEVQAVALLREAAREALALGDATGAAALLARALDEPPTADERPAVVLELGLARARAGAPDAFEPLSEVIAHDQDESAIVAAAIELSGMLFFAGRAPEAAAILRRARDRLPPGGSRPRAPRRGAARCQLHLGLGTSRSRLGDRLAERPGRPGAQRVEATTLATLAMDELMYLRSAAKAKDYALRSLAAGLPSEPHRGEAWSIVALAVLLATDELDAAQRGTDDVLARARARGAAVTVASMSAMRALICLRRGDLPSAQADAQVAIELAPDVLGAEFVVLAVAAAVLAGLDRDESPESLRRLIDRVGIRYDTEFSPSSQLRYASAMVRAAAGNHQAAVEELLRERARASGPGRREPGGAPLALGGRAVARRARPPRRGRSLADDEVRRAQTFGTPRALGIALRAQALVGPPAQRSERLQAALDVLAPSPARLEHARVLLDLGATLRAAGQRVAAREPLLEALMWASRCGARSLERRARAELAAIGVRPTTTDRAGADSLTPSERRVVELAAAGGTNREIAQTLFVTEKTVETHLGRAFRKLNVSSRRQLPDVLASAT